MPTADRATYARSPLEWAAVGSEIRSVNGPFRWVAVKRKTASRVSGHFGDSAASRERRPFGGRIALFLPFFRALGEWAGGPIRRNIDLFGGFSFKNGKP